MADDWRCSGRRTGPGILYPSPACGSALRSNLRARLIAPDLRQEPGAGKPHAGIRAGEDVDIGIRDGLALRWSFMGPFETIDLNAPAGVRDYVERYQKIYAGIFPSTQWRVDWSGPVMDTIEAERRARLPADKLAERQSWRDRRLMALAAHKRRADRDIGR
jgi:hypothetical protein